MPSCAADTTVELVDTWVTLSPNSSLPFWPEQLGQECSLCTLCTPLPGLGAVSWPSAPHGVTGMSQSYPNPISVHV